MQTHAEWSAQEVASQPNGPAWRCTLKPIAFEPQLLPEDGSRFAYGARSEAASYVGALLCESVPSLREGTLEIVAIARRPGVLTKVAIRPARGSIAPIHVGIGADHLAPISEQLDGERIEVVRWQPRAAGYIADALGLGEVPPMLLLPGLGHARVLLGEIDVRGIAGWRGLNTILASALTGWRIRLESMAATGAWARLQAAMHARRPVAATVVGFTPRGPRVDVLGLYAVLPNRAREVIVGQELEVRITRMDADEGRIFAIQAQARGRQLALAGWSE